MSKSPEDLFELDGGVEPPPFELTPLDQNSPELDQLDPNVGQLQPELFLPQYDEEHPAEQPQRDLRGLEKPEFMVAYRGQERALSFQHAPNLLQSLEAQGVTLPYQCREGYCGSCRTKLIEGEVAYLQPALAWVNEGEILPCICVPKSDVQLADPLDV